jgi:excisionase family DNA binding protein
MLDASDLAYLLDLGRDSTYQALDAGKFPAIRVGRAWRVPAHRLATEILGCTVDDIVAALATRDEEGSAPP